MEFLDYLKELGGYWNYKGGPYLAKLASGKVSDTFANTGVITTDPVALRIAAEELIQKLDTKPIDGITSVIGPGMGGITLAYQIAAELNKRSFMAKAYFTEPYEAGGNKLQSFTRFELSENTGLLFCEDVITTGGSVQKTIQAVKNTNLNKDLKVIPAILCLIDRREQKGPINIKIKNNEGEKEFDFKCISLASITPKTWDTIEDAQKELPQVKEALRPKTSWQQLTTSHL